MAFGLFLTSLGVHLATCVLAAHAVGQGAGDEEDGQVEDAEAEAGPADDVHVVVPELLELGAAAGPRLVDRGGVACGLAVQVAAAGSGNRKADVVVVGIARITAAAEGFLKNAHGSVVMGVPEQVNQIGHIAQEGRSVHEHPAREHQLQDEEHKNHAGVLQSIQLQLARIPWDMLFTQTYRAGHADTLPKNAVAPEEGHHEDEASQDGDADGDGVRVRPTPRDIEAAQIGQHDRAQHDQ